jgi:hypothetical protein
MAPISPRAVELYQQMRRLRCTCPPPKPGRNVASLADQCRGCSRWWSLHSELDQALGPTKPWLWPHLREPTRFCDHDGVLRPYPPLQHQAELAARLRAAAKAGRSIVIARGGSSIDRGLT